MKTGAPPAGACQKTVFPADYAAMKKRSLLLCAMVGCGSVSVLLGADQLPTTITPAAPTNVTAPAKTVPPAGPTAPKTTTPPTKPAKPDAKAPVKEEPLVGMLLCDFVGLPECEYTLAHARI
jgi:hypothetical protein